MIHLLAPDLHCLQDISWDIFSGSWGTMWALSLGLCRGIAAAASALGLPQLSNLKIPSKASPTGSAGASPSLVLCGTGGIQLTTPPLQECACLGWGGKRHHEHLWEMAPDSQRGSVGASGAQW